MPLDKSVLRRFSRKYLAIGLLLALFVCAFLMRIWGLHSDVQSDELAWVWRSIHFRAALLSANWADTVYTGHPGVTTMVIGALGIQLRAWLDPAATLPSLSWLARLAWLEPDNAQAFVLLGRFLATERVFIALVTALGVVGMYVIGRRVLGQGAAALAAFMVALDPFVASLSGLAHVDGLLATFTMLSLLSFLAGLAARRLYVWMAISGLLAGLAVLTKSPALMLGPVCGLALLLGWWWMRKDRPLRQWVLAGLVWLAVLLLVVAAWPALWTNQARVWELVTGTAGRHLERQTEQAGQTFYLLVLAFRSTPVTLSGVLAALAFLVSDRHRSETLWLRRAVIILIVWGGAFLGLSTVWGTKYDRYAAPALAALAFVAGLGWWWLVSNVWRLARSGKLAAGGLAAGVLLAQVGTALPLAPHLAMYANPILGGSAMAAQQGLVQPGDPSLSQAAAYLDHLPGARQMRVATLSPSTFAPLFRGQTLLLSPEALSVADWAVLANGKMGCALAGADWRLEKTFRVGESVTLVCVSPYAKLQLDYLSDRVQPGDVVLLDAETSLACDWASNIPLHIVEDPGEPLALLERVAAASADARRVWYVNYPAASPVTRGWIEQALEQYASTSERHTVAQAAIHLYTMKAAVDVNGIDLRPLGRFEDKMVLWGAGLVSEPATYPAMRVVLRWQVNAVRDYQVELELRDMARHGRAEVSASLVSREMFAASRWAVGQTYESVLDIQLPLGLSPGEYQLVARLKDEVTGAYLGVWESDNFVGTACPLGTVEVVSPQTFIATRALKMRKTLQVEAGALDLLGIGIWPDGGLSGDTLTYSLYWRARESTSQDYRVRWRLTGGDEQVHLEQLAPLSVYPTSRWRPDEVIESLYDIALDPLLPGDVYTVSLNVLDASGLAIWEQDLRLKKLEISQPDRLFALPDSEHPLNVQVGTEMLLRGYDLGRDGTFSVTLYWQTNQNPQHNYAGFVHVLDSAGNVIVQGDHLLTESGQVTSGWAAGQVALDFYQITLPAGVPLETLRVGVGLYDADTSQRVTITLPDGTHPPRNRLILDAPLE